MGRSLFFLLHSSANRREASVASAVKLGLAPVEAVGALVELFLKGPKLVRGVAMGGGVQRTSLAD